jgi:sugar phosphate isomerase/epimerase
MDTLNRRNFLAAAALGVGAAHAVSNPTTHAKETPGNKRNVPKFRYCLNTSTIRVQKIGIVEEVELAAKTGYDGIEPWVRQLTAYQEQGGSLKDLKKRIADHGLRVESAIGFANWIVDDDEKRKKGLEDAKRDMDLVKQIGGTRIAAPPAGATKGASVDLFKAAERYRALLEVGASIGVIPQVEVWGFSKNLSRLGETVFVAVESGHKDACILPDVYHIYKGGSDFAGLEILAGSSVHCFHVNDYPSDPPRNTIADRDRVYPGDGVAPLNYILQTMAANGFEGALSLELFNPNYWKQDPELVVRTGLEKTKAAVAKAFA